MDVGFWMRSSASTSTTLHVHTLINSHTFCPRGLWLLMTVMMDLGRHRTHVGRELGQCQSWFGIDPSRVPITQC